MYILVYIYIYIYTHTHIYIHIYRGAVKSLAQPTSRCILFDGENISFDAGLVIQGVTGGTDQTSGECSLC